LGLFMDRHELPGLTAEQVAQAHLRDLEVGAKLGVQFLPLWFDSNDGTAFCLADAPSPEAMQAVHRESHGMIPSEIIGVSQDMVLKFLGTVRVDHTELATAFRTVLFTDLEGSTALLHQGGQAAYMTLLAEHDGIIRRALVSAAGREVKHTGDGIMAAFDVVAQALECSAAIQDGFHKRTAAGATPDLRVRIGLAAGEPVDHNDDMFGATVNLASRICAAAEAGHVLVSKLVRDLGVKRGFSFSGAGERAFRGFPGPVAVFELRRVPASHARHPS
jgi:class 3 adenylate cyclase